MEGFKQRYLTHFTRYPQQTTQSPHPQTFVTVVIPCLNEPAIIQTLESLWKGDRPVWPAEILVVLNHASDAPDEVKAYNAETFKAIEEWAANHSDANFRVLPLWFGDIKPKLAGVGTARKLGMDEAVYRFYQISQPEGIIACLDADCEVAPNYLPALEQHFREHPKATGASISFSHPLDKGYRHAILDFELYLRYYKNALFWAGFPYAYHTIGSAMAVPCYTYQRVGGMNKQKAGEDFYFIEKLVYQGCFTELNRTTVYPSPRQSLRVPFGTGQAVADYIAEEPDQLAVFNPQSFQELRNFMEQLPGLYQNSGVPNAELPPAIKAFLEERNWQYFLHESLRYSHSAPGFLKRFFHWFDAFKALQFLHQARDQYYSNVPVAEASQWLYRAMGYADPAPDREGMLWQWRAHDREAHGRPNPQVPF